MESKLFEDVRHKIAEQLTRIQETAKAIAQLDVLASFATVSIRNDYMRPPLTTTVKPPSALRRASMATTTH